MERKNWKLNEQINPKVFQKNTVTTMRKGKKRTNPSNLWIFNKKTFSTGWCRELQTNPEFVEVGLLYVVVLTKQFWNTFGCIKRLSKCAEVLGARVFTDERTQNKEKTYNDKLEVSMWTHDFLKSVTYRYIHVYVNIYIGIYVYSLYTHIFLSSVGQKSQDANTL